MFSKSAIITSAVALAGHLSQVNGQVCFNVGLGPSGDCYVDPRATEKFQAYLLPNTDVTGCTSGGEFDVTVTYTDVQDIDRTVHVLSPITLDDGAKDPGLLNFNLPVKDIKDDSEVTMTLSAWNEALETPFTTEVVYTHHQQSSILYTTGTATNTVYTTKPTSVTTVVSNTAYKTVTPGFLRTQTKTTATATVNLQPRSTVTSTFSSPAVTFTSWFASTTTKTFACDAQNTVVAQAGPGSQRLARRKFFEITNSAPVCSVPATTIITNAFKTITAKSTIVDIISKVVPTTVTSTITAKPVTKYIGATTTVTSSSAVQKFTVWVKPARSTAVTKRTSTITSWVQPTGKNIGACKVDAAFTAGPVAAISASVS